ncbi:hypothetical protein ABPG75_009331 [Micractinium tetrahymenae]
MATQGPFDGASLPVAGQQSALAPPPPSPTAPGTPAAPAAAPAAQPTLPAYLGSALEPFVRQADVLFLAAGGAALPAHSQLLARCCSLFADILEASHCATEQPGGEGSGPMEAHHAALALRGRPSPGAPLRVPVQAHSSVTVQLLLQAVYQPHCLQEMVASLTGAAAYGALADLAAFCGFGDLLDALRSPLSRRSTAMGLLVGWDFPGWLEVAERHNLDALRGYCLECLLHMLAAPGSSRQVDEPPLEGLHWDLLSKSNLLLLLDGLAAGVRRCTQGSYELRARVPCTAAASLLGGSPAAAPAGSGGSVGAAPWASLPAAGAGGGGAAYAYMGAAAADPPGQAQQGQPMVGWGRSHVAALRVPMLRQGDLRASLPGGQEIACWHAMGDLCQGAAGPAGS